MAADSRKSIPFSTSLASLNPTLAQEWHPTKNAHVTPEDVPPGSTKKIWWKCRENDEHEWEAQVRARTNGTGCPICANKKVIPSTSLKMNRPGFTGDKIL
jgi:hypothetical protein